MIVLKKALAAGSVLAGLFALMLLGGAPDRGRALPALAQSTEDVVTAVLLRTVNTGEWEPPSPEPAAIAYLPPGSAAAEARLLIADATLPGSDDDDDDYEGANVFLTDLQGNVRQTFDTSSFARNVTGLAWQPQHGHLFIVDADDHRLFDVSDPWGAPTIVEINSRRFGSGEPQDVAYDANAGLLFVLDGRERTVHQIDLGPNGRFDDEDSVVILSVAHLGLERPRGLSYDAATDHLLIVDRDDDLIVEMTKAGSPVREIDISAASPRNAAALALLPADGPVPTRTLLVLDRGTRNDDDGDDGDAHVESLGAQPVANHAPAPLDHEEGGGFLFIFELLSIVDTATPTPPSATGTPDATSTPDATATPGATATPDGGPPDAVAYLPLVAVRREHDAWGEPNNSCTRAFPLLTNYPYSFRPEDEHDWYHFALQEAASVTVRLSDFSPQSGQIAAYFGESCESAVFLLNNGESDTQKTLALGLQPAGHYYLYVSNDGQPVNQPYRLVVEAR